MRNLEMQAAAPNSRNQRESTTNSHRKSPCAGKVGVFSALLAVAICCLLSGHVTGQVIDDESFDAQLDEVFLMPNRSQLQWMRSAENYIKEGQFNNAVRFLAQVLDSESDFFIRTPGSETFASFKRKAERMIGELPPEGLAAYDNLFGPVAERQLRAAVAEGDIDGLIECARRYFHTDSGARATWLLAQHYLDRGQPLTAATLFQRLQSNVKAQELEPNLSLMVAMSLHRAGRTSEARVAAMKLRHDFPDARFEFAGRSLPVFANEANAIGWLAGISGAEAQDAESIAEWLLPRGVPSGNAVVEADRPISIPRWRLPTTTDEETQNNVRKLESEFATSRPPVIALPGAQPLAIGDHIIVRTQDALMAVDFETGKRAFPLSMLPTAEVNVAAPNSLDMGARNADLLALERSLIDDTNQSMISSDGENVYFVADESQHRAPYQLFLPADGVGQYGLAPETNWLEARSLKSDGKLLWTLGGPTTAGNPLAGALFLGPPLPLDGVLYCLVEWDKAIELVAIQPLQDLGGVEVLWKQHLAAVQDRYGYEMLRRLVGVSPSFADGFLVCPTGSGAVVAVDLSTKSLQWGFKYDQSAANYATRTQHLTAGRAGNRSGRWVDSTAVIAGGKVFLTPPFAERLYCLDLITGKVQWDVPRDKGLYLAAATKESVHIVGTQQVDAYNVQTGARTAEIPFPSGVAPAGKGVQTPQAYLLPLNNGEIAVCDLEAGVLTQRIVLPGMAGQERPRLGNLIAYRGSIISQSLRGVDCFYQLEALQQRTKSQLAKDANDPEALTNQALVDLEGGNRDRAISLLRQSLKIRSDELTRILLVNNLRAILREDFAGNRDLDGEVKDLLVTAEERIAFLNDVAYGLYTSGEYRASFDVYVELADLTASGPASDKAKFREPNEGWKVRQDRYLGARIMNLYAMGDRADQAYMDEEISSRLPGVSLTSDRQELQQDAHRLRSFIANFSGHVAANTARLHLAITLSALDPHDFEIELLLRQVQRTGLPDQQSQALLNLTDWHLKEKDIPAARLAYEALIELQSEAELSATIGIQQLAARVAAAGARDSRTIAWGEWDKQAPENENPGPLRLLMPLINDRAMIASKLERTPGALLWDNNNAGYLVQRDEMGKTAWSVPLDAEIGARRYIAPTANRFRNLGQLRLISLGERLIAVGSRDRSAVILGEETFGGAFMSAGIGEVRTNSHRHPWGQMRDSLSDIRSRSLGVMALLSEDCLCILQGQDIIARHPTLQGEILWQRRVEKNVELMFGSEDRVFLVHGETATVLRAADGELLGERDVPPPIDMITSVGDDVVHWEQPWQDREKGKVVISLNDCWAGTSDQPVHLWKREFAAGSKAQMISDKRLVLVEPNGSANVLDLKTGKSEWEFKVTPEDDLSMIYALEHEGTLTVIVNTSENFNTSRSVISAFPGTPIGGVRVNGWVYGFDLHNREQLWKQRIGNHGIWLDQPGGLPVLVFACSANLRTEQQQQRVNTLLILEKRTGATLYKTDSVMSTASNYEISGDPQTGIVEFEWPNAARLTFGFARRGTESAGASNSSSHNSPSSAPR